MSANVMPLICNSCGVDFLVNEGGTCRSCGKLYCGYCLYTFDEEHGNVYCVSCRKPDARAKPILDRTLGSPLWERRKLLGKRRADKRRD